LRIPLTLVASGLGSGFSPGQVWFTFSFGVSRECNDGFV
jgi:hypothetical protein